MTIGDLYAKKTLLGLPNRYAGLTYTAKQISLFFPKCKIYVECFAGLGRTAKYVNCDIMILNDKSKFSNNYCEKKFPNAIIENMDFIDTIKKYDSLDTFFLIDPVWRTDFYDGSIKFTDKPNHLPNRSQTIKNKKNTEILKKTDLNKLKKLENLSFCDRSSKQYLEDLNKILPTIKGHYIITLNKNGKFNSKYTHFVKYHKKVIFGNYPSTKLFSNKPFKRNCLEITDYF
tara:strand:- start:2082 stop:2771 length:690 start_codon:yes stop_codon:yes gene_type:complete